MLYATVEDVLNRCFKRHCFGKHELIAILNVQECHDEDACAILRKINICRIYDFVLNGVTELSQSVVNNEECMSLPIVKQAIRIVSEKSGLSRADFAAIL